MKLILLNGPPRSGKDTAAKALYYSKLQGNEVTPLIGFERFSMPIKRAFAGTVDALIDQFGNVATFENIKEQPLDLLNGKSYRQWQIEFSESFMKPLYGEDIFARLMFRSLLDHAESGVHLLIIPDCGFQIEVDYILKRFRNDYVYLMRLHRPNCDFSSDSRNYVTAPESVQQLDVFNDAGQPEFEEKILLLVKAWLGGTS